MSAKKQWLARKNFWGHKRIGRKATPKRSVRTERGMVVHGPHRASFFTYQPQC